MSRLIALLVLTTLRYFGNDTTDYFQPEIYLDRIVVPRVHIAAAIIAAQTGPLRFVPYIRNKFRAVYRTVGKVYVVAVLIGASFGLLIATTAMGGVESEAGFSGLAILWGGGTTIIGFLRIHERDIAGHKKWMIRSFALTFAFVMLRVIFGDLQFGVGLSEVTAIQIAVWACWIPNLLVVEYMMRRKMTCAA